MTTTFRGSATSPASKGPEHASRRITTDVIQILRQYLEFIVLLSLFFLLTLLFLSVFTDDLAALSADWWAGRQKRSNATRVGITPFVAVISRRTRCAVIGFARST
jgi:hypothetical protein